MKEVGLKSLDKAQRKISFTACCLKSGELQFVNIFSVDKFTIL
jgi:hypothetical protein